MEYTKSPILASDKLLSDIYKVNKSRNLIKNQKNYLNSNYLTTDLHFYQKSLSSINQIQTKTVTHSNHEHHFKNQVNLIQQKTMGNLDNNKTKNNHHRSNDFISFKTRLMTQANKNINCLNSLKNNSKSLNNPKGTNRLIKKSISINNPLPNNKKPIVNAFHRHMKSSDVLKENNFYDRFHCKTADVLYDIYNSPKYLHDNIKDKTVKQIINEENNCQEDIEKLLFEKKVNDNNNNEFSNGNNLPSEIKNNDQEHKENHSNQYHMNEMYNNQSPRSLIELKELQEKLNGIEKKDRNGYNHNYGCIDINKKLKVYRKNHISPFRIYPSNSIGMNYDKKLLYVYKALNNK